MNESLTTAAYLRSKGYIPNAASNVSIRGADFQDFKGIPGAGYVMAHRSPGAIHIGGRNLADYVGPFSRYGKVGNPISRPSLLHMAVAFQARTDPMPRSGNYADTYLETFLRVPLSLIVEHLLAKQKSNQPLEKSALVDAIGRAQELLYQGYQAAVLRNQEVRADKGWVETSGGLFHNPFADLSDAEIEMVPKSEGGSLELVSDRRPTDAGTEPQLELEMSRSIARSATLVQSEASVSDAIAELDSASRQT